MEDMLFGDNNNPYWTAVETGVPLIERAVAILMRLVQQSFGDEVLAKEPSRSSDRARTSYVVLEYKFKDDMTTITGHDPKAATPATVTMLVSTSSEIRMLPLIFRLLAAWQRATQSQLHFIT